MKHHVRETRVIPVRKSLDELYEATPVKVDLTTMDVDMIDILTIKNLQNNLVSITPQCLCGELNGFSNLGDECINCHTRVTDGLGTYMPIVWVSAPNDEKIFIAPQYWSMLNEIIKSSASFDSLAWLTNTAYRSTLMVPKVLEQMVEEIPGFKRSYRYVVEHLEDILVYLLNNSKLYPKRGKIRDMLELFIAKKDYILSSKVPLPSRELFLMEDTSFNSKKVNLVTGVIKTLALNYKDAVTLGRDLDRPISRLISELAQVFDMNVNDFIHGKNRIVRSNIFGTKVPGSFRAVVVPITGPHHYEDMIIPWTIAIISFRTFLVSRLLDKGYRYVDVCEKLDKHTFKFDEEIRQEMQAIIDEAKAVNGRGVSVAKNRNPTQHRFSIINLYITEFKTDPLNFTIETSPLICAALNEDYDGDETNQIIAMDLHMEREFKRFSLHYGAMLPTKPYSTSKALSMPDTAVINIACYIMNDRDEEQYINPSFLSKVGV